MLTWTEMNFFSAAVITSNESRLAFYVPDTKQSERLRFLSDWTV